MPYKVVPGGKRAQLVKVFEMTQCRVQQYLSVCHVGEQ